MTITLREEIKNKIQVQSRETLSTRFRRAGIGRHGKLHVQKTYVPNLKSNSIGFPYVHMYLCS